MCTLCSLGETAFHNSNSFLHNMTANVEKQTSALAQPLGNQLPITGDWRIDSITQGSKWGNTQLTYSLWDNFFDIWGDSLSGLSGLLLDWDVESKATIRTALDAFQNVSGLNFTYEETNGARSMTSDLEIMGTGFVQQFTIGSIGLGVFPDPSFGDQWLQLLGVSRAEYPNVEGSIYLDNFGEVFQYDQPGGRGYWVILHEIGHALGLKHTHDDGGVGRPSLESLGLEQYDNTLYSIMSYHAVEGSTIDYGNVASLMPNDILAIQALYGENWSYNNGDTTYSLSDNGQVKAIWDGGGIDTFDATSLGTGTMLDLRAGQYSAIGATQNAIAYKVTIENAKGSNSADTIIGNEANNTLYGFHGADTLYGGKGNDSLFGGQAIADSGDQADVIYGDKGDDFIVGNSGDDTLFGGSNMADTLDGSDEIYAGYGADVIYGNSGNDSLYGGGGIAAPNDLGDSIYGGWGDDAIYANGGNDSVYGNAGNDYLHGGLGDDVYYLLSGDGTDTIAHFQGAGISGGDLLSIVTGINGQGVSSASDVIARTSYNNGNAWIDLGGGNGVTILGIATLGTDDILIA